MLKSDSKRFFVGAVALQNRVTLLAEHDEDYSTGGVVTALFEDYFRGQRKIKELVQERFSNSEERSLQVDLIRRFSPDEETVRTAIKIVKASGAATDDEITRWKEAAKVKSGESLPWARK